jgi:hypothetical protein
MTPCHPSTTHRQCVDCARYRPEREPEPEKRRQGVIDATALRWSRLACPMRVEDRDAP